MTNATNNAEKIAANLTALEVSLIETILSDDHFNDFQGIEGDCWTDVLSDSWVNGSFERTARQFSGVVSSLVKKGIIKTDSDPEDGTIWFVQSELVADVVEIVASDDIEDAMIVGSESEELTFAADEVKDDEVQILETAEEVVARLRAELEAVKIENAKLKLEIADRDQDIRTVKALLTYDS